ncbi:MAG TPA: class I SAM-dependent methyltransferase [Candidatus Didemnitutus sp.]|nr:class I SAM-dependent methyltransferase [Candidatus Didemnitutus sp.]
MKADFQLFDTFAEDYDTVVSIERKYVFFLEHLPQRRGAVLDVGCGGGLLSLELSNHFKRVTAIDISAPMLAIAQRKRGASNIEYRLCDADKFTSDTRFDAIVSHTTFDHLPDVPATLAKLKRCLASGGRLIVIDCVARMPAIVPRWGIFYRILALMHVLPDMIRYRSKEAWALLRFRMSRAWIAHLQSDNYFSPARFIEVYAASLPGAHFTEMSNFIGVVWTAPTDKEEPNHSPEPMAALRTAMPDR